jgi:2-methylcitrate dehydratase PrpD
MLDSSDLDRRTMLRGTGALATLSMLGRGVSEVAAAQEYQIGDGPATEVPEGARTVAAGLETFVTKWNAGVGVVIAATRFGRFLVNRTFNCTVTDTGENYVLSLPPEGAAVEIGRDPSANAHLVLDTDDWEAVLYGDYTGLAPVVGGEAFPAHDEANKEVLLLLVMYVFANLPAGASNDPELLIGTIAGAVQRGGIPECEGAPPALENAEEIQNNPEGRLEQRLAGTNDTPDVTRQLAEWVSQLEYGDIPEGEIETAKAQLKSIVGTLYAGSTTDPGATFAGAMGELGNAGESTVVGTDSYDASAADAALVNSFLGQCLEWDDFTYLAHSGASIVPAALAAAEAGGASGEELLTAIVAGNEIIARVSDFLTDVVRAGQALAVHQAELPFVAGKALGLGATELQDAAGIAATQPQTTSIPAWTAPAKGMVTGQPAHTSVRAAQLAGAGLVGRRNLLENPLGYFYAIADIRTPAELETAVSGLGENWRFSEQYFNKRYPTNGFHLTAVTAALDVREKLVEAGVDPSDPSRIDAVTIRVPLVTAATGTMFSKGQSDYIYEKILDDDQPDWTYIALLYDSTYPVLASLLDGELTEAQYREDRIGSDAIRNLYGKSEAVPDLSNGIFGAKVVVEAGGEEYSSFVGCIESVDADAKFRTTANGVLSSSEIEKVLGAIDDLESFEDVNEFAALLEPSGSGGGSDGCGTPGPDVTGDGAPARDPDCDGRYEDVNGDGQAGVVDVQGLFAHREESVVQSNPGGFDFSGDGTVNVVDVQALFTEVS